MSHTASLALISFAMITGELSLNSYAHIQHRCLFESTINSCNLQQMGFCTICLAGLDKMSPWPLIWRQIRFLVGYD